MAPVMELMGKALWTQAKGHSMYAGEYHADKKKSHSQDSQALKGGLGSLWVH